MAESVSVSKDTPPLPSGPKKESTTHQASPKDTSSYSHKDEKIVAGSRDSKKGDSGGGTVDSTTKEHKSVSKPAKDLKEEDSSKSRGVPLHDQRGSHSVGRYRRDYYYEGRQRGRGRPRSHGDGDSRSRSHRNTEGKSRSHGDGEGRDKRDKKDKEADKKVQLSSVQERGQKSHRKTSQDQARDVEVRTHHKDSREARHRVDKDGELSIRDRERNERMKVNPGQRRGPPKLLHKNTHDPTNARSDGYRPGVDGTTSEDKPDKVCEQPKQDVGSGGAQSSKDGVRTQQGRGRNHRPRQRNKGPLSTPREKSLSLTQSQSSAIPNTSNGNKSSSNLTEQTSRDTQPSDSACISLASEAMPEDSQQNEKPPSPPQEGTKRTGHSDYTKRKYDKPSQRSRFKGRPRGQRSVPTVQSDQLAQELTAGTYECMVCCERVRGRDQVWSCEGCYHVFHLKCIKKWASAPTLGAEEGTPDGWQCPSCRRASTVVPTVYRCFCGRVVNPRSRGRGELTVPHTCGDTCLKSLAVGPESSCRHKCRLPCHPGPCPPCPVMVTRTCPCGVTSYHVRCSRTGDLPSCGSVCGCGLACGRHSCEYTCHSGPCPTCEQVLTQQCHCGRETKQSICGQEKSAAFSCGQVCNKELDCGNHLCELLCHEGACPSCPLLPSAVTTCPCGATPLSELLPEGEERMSCFDPVPTCEQVCGKILPCSTNSDDSHRCPAPCHLGACPSCDKTSSIRCVCGSTTMSVPCVEVVGGKGVELKCGRVCNKKKSCGRHRCNTRCCVDTEHKCELLCGKKLQCGLHYCQESCHRGHCEQCWEYSYRELTCHCGAEIIHPPIPCGTRPPPCSRPCARMHPCGHPVTHSCHNDETCPPCTFLTEKMCMGGHELRCNIPCHLTDVSCGVPCGRPLPCNMHKCQRTCHRGNCDEFSCQQPCTNKRKLCDHPCGEPCHVGGACPDTQCQAKVELKCECGRKKERVVCMASESGAMRQTFQMFSKELGSSGEIFNISTITATNRSRNKTLECDEVCRQVRRNKELAAALDIERPIVNPLESGSSGETVQYSPYLLEEARSNLEFVAEVEEALRALVELAVKGPPSKSHKHSFRPMKSNQRKIIHEMSVYYGCETTSFDPEPMRSVTVYATKSQVKLPSVSLAKLIERERYKPPPAPLHVMTVSDRVGSTPAKKLAQLGEPDTIPDYFADDLKL